MAEIKRPTIARCSMTGTHYVVDLLHPLRNGDEIVSKPCPRCGGTGDANYIPEGTVIEYPDGMGGTVRQRVGMGG